MSNKNYVTYEEFGAVGDGVTGFSQQLYKHCYTEAGSIAKTYYPKTVFHFYTYVFAALVLLVLFVIYHVQEKRLCGTVCTENTRTPEKPAVSLRAVVHIFVMAVCLFAANYLQTVATNDLGLSSQMLYPILKGGCLITVNFTAMIFFGERITKRSVIGSLVALFGIVIMSVL